METDLVERKEILRQMEILTVLEQSPPKLLDTRIFHYSLHRECTQLDYSVVYKAMEHCTARLCPC